MSTQTDFLALEPLVLARIASQVLVDGNPIDAISRRNAPGANQTGGRTPRIELSYDGYSIVNDESDDSAVIVQTFTAAVCVENVRDAARAGARADAGPMLLSLLRALLGWQPPAVNGERVFAKLKLASPSFRPTYLDNLSYFPLTFTTRLVVTGAGA